MPPPLTDADVKRIGVQRRSLARLPELPIPPRRFLDAHGGPRCLGRGDLHPAEVDLSALLNTLVALLRRYVVFPKPSQADACALWIAHTHVLDAFEVTPYLNVRSAEKRSGKTRVIEVLQQVVPRPWHAVNPTEAVLFRKIEQQRPTILLDEVDAIFKEPQSSRTEGLRATLNSGYRRGATVDRCDKTAHGTNLVAFKVFGPKLLAGIGTLPDTVGDRCIPIVLQRKRTGEQVAKFRPRDFAPEAAPIRAALEVWASGAIDRLRDTRPHVPDTLNDRSAEVWEPLLAIADEAGGDWPLRSRAAAVELNGGEPDVESFPVTLLRAIFDVFHERKADRILTTDLLAALVEREGEPWPTWWGTDVDMARKGSETPRAAAAKLAAMLKPFEVFPRSLRTVGGKGKGYYRSDFADAFERYLRVQSRDNGTTLGAQGFEASRPASAWNGGGTAETLAAQALSRCPDLDCIQGVV